MGIEILSNDMLDGIFKNTYRHYLVGAFQEASLKDDNIEVGISNYRSFTYDMPHYHPRVTEYQYVIAGESALFDISNDRVYHLKQGDFFIVKPNTHYAEKHKSNTKVLFFKFPGENDKILIEVSYSIEMWLKDEVF